MPFQWPPVPAAAQGWYDRAYGTAGSHLDLRHAYAAECIQSLADGSVQCVVCDPPFGLGEDTFDKHYARKPSHVIPGYKTAPTANESYEAWTRQWLHEIPRVLAPDGTLYVVCAWNHVCDVERAIRTAPAPGLTVLNHIIWKYNFGVYAQKKFVTSHYHILRCGRGTADSTAFYPRAYYNETDEVVVGAKRRKAQYADMEDVWSIPRENSPGKAKNVNKLPDALVRKMVRYSSKPGDTVADFFMGNFTTAYVARREGRSVVGCDANAHVCAHHIQRVQDIPAPSLDDPSLHEKPSTKPKNAGQPVTDEERACIRSRYAELRASKTKKASIAVLGVEFERGAFSLANIVQGTS